MPKKNWNPSSGSRSLQNDAKIQDELDGLKNDKPEWLLRAPAALKKGLNLLTGGSGEPSNPLNWPNPYSKKQVAADKPKWDPERRQTPGAAALFKKSVKRLKKKGQYSSSDTNSPSARMVRESDN